MSQKNRQSRLGGSGHFPSGFSLTLGYKSSILESLRGVAPGVCVDVAGPGRQGSIELCRKRASRLFDRSLKYGRAGQNDAILTRTGLFGSGWKQSPYACLRVQRRIALWFGF